MELESVNDTGSEILPLAASEPGLHTPARSEGCPDEFEIAKVSWSLCSRTE